MTLYPLLYNRALFKYSALREYAQLADVNPSLAPSIVKVNVFPDMSVSAPLSSRKEAETFSQLLQQYAVLSRFWTFQGIENLFEGFLYRWKIQISYQHLTPLVVSVDNLFFIIIDTENFILPEITEGDRIYLRQELFKYYNDCSESPGAISSNELSYLSLEKMFELIILKDKGQTYCYTRDKAIEYSTSDDKTILNPDYGYYGYFGMPLVGGLLYPIYDLPRVLPTSSVDITIDGDGGFKVVLIDGIFFIDIKTNKTKKLKGIVKILYNKGKLFTPWGGSYMLYEHKLSSAGLINNPILTDSENEKQILDYLEML
jgi:hypothetical protein